MQKLSIALTVTVLLGLLASSSSSAIAPQRLVTGEVELQPVVTLSDAAERVRGKAAIIDNGEELVVRAAARGLLPNETYVSLFYDRKSITEGATCTGDALFIGEWKVGKKGSGALSSIQTTSFRLGDFRTMSIRRITELGPVLVSCGAIQTP